MYGSRLYDQPKHRAVAEAITAFAALPGPLGVEIGFDHGMCILDRARCFPEWNHIGVELREKRVLAAREHAPANTLLLRVDGRTLLTRLLPPDSVSALYLLFPTPVDRPERQLLSPLFADSVRRVLGANGALWFATDVPALAAHFDELFAWPTVSSPPLGTELSRRERVCRRDGIEVHRRCVGVPDRARE